jgi:hypothetical protein
LEKLHSLTVEPLSFFSKKINHEKSMFAILLFFNTMYLPPFSILQKDPVSNDLTDLHLITEENQFSSGWLGSENDGQLYQDILLFGNSNLPSKVDLTTYLPPVQSQGQYGTCVAWATGYYTKTAMNAIDKQYNSSQLGQESKQAGPKDLSGP